MKHVFGTDKVRFYEKNGIKMATDISEREPDKILTFIHKDNAMDMIGLNKEKEEDWKEFHRLFLISSVMTFNMVSRLQNVAEDEFIYNGIESKEQAEKMDEFEKKYAEEHKDDPEGDDIWCQDQLPIELRYYDYINLKIAYCMLLNANTQQARDFKAVIALKVYPEYDKLLGPVMVGPSLAELMYKYAINNPDKVTKVEGELKQVIINHKLSTDNDDNTSENK